MSGECGEGTGRDEERVSCVAGKPEGRCGSPAPVLWYHWAVVYRSTWESQTTPPHAKSDCFVTTPAWEVHLCLCLWEEPCIGIWDWQKGLTSTSRSESGGTLYSAEELFVEFRWGAGQHWNKIQRAPQVADPKFLFFLSYFFSFIMFVSFFPFILFFSFLFFLVFIYFIFSFSVIPWKRISPVYLECRTGAPSPTRATAGSAPSCYNLRPEGMALGWISVSMWLGLAA